MSKYGLSNVRNWLFSRRESLLLSIVALGCCAATVWLFAPGYMSLDSAHQLRQARSLELNDRHPISMALLWHVLDRIVPGPFGMLLLFNALYWWGLAAIFACRRWPLWLRALAIPAVGFYPPVFCISGAIWKDTLMQGLLLAAIGCFSKYARARGKGWLIGALVLTLFAMTVRHNAIGATWPLVALPILAVPALSRLRLVFRLLVAAALSIAGSVAALALTLKLLAALAAPAHFWQLIATFDLAGISVRTGKLEIDADSKVLAPGATLAEVRRVYRPFEHLTLYRCMPRRHPCRKVFVGVDEADQLSALARNWRRVVLAHPREYLEHRYAVYELVAGLGGHKAKLWFSNAGDIAKDYPLPRRANDALSWFRRVSATWWMTVWLYLGLATACAVASLFFLSRTKSAMPLALALSSLSYSASLFFGTGAPDYRYSEWSVMSAVLALLLLLESWRPTPTLDAS